MKKLSIIAMLMALVLSAPALSQPADTSSQPAATASASADTGAATAEQPKPTGNDTATTTDVAKDNEGDGGTDDEVTAEELAKQAEKIAQDWEKLGWMGGVIAIIGFLIMLLRFKPINNFLEDKKLKWIKPYIAVGLGVLCGFFTALFGGAVWYQALIAGLIAGVAVPGFHQIFTGANRKKAEKPA